MSITNYEKYMPEASAKGKLVNYQEYSAETKAAAEIIPFGSAVQLSADGQTITTVKASGAPYGVALATEIHDWVTNADDQKYLQYDAVAVVRKGVIWVEAGEDIITGDGVKVDPATGKFYPADTATTGVVTFPSAIFKSSATAGSLVQLEINLP
jgi:sugar lactone lactonase YvrE